MPPMQPLQQRSTATGPVTLRALSLLEIFLPGSTTHTLTEMSDLTGLPLSTTHRLASDLVAWGALEKRTDGKFQVGARLRQIATNAPHDTLIREQCLPPLTRLSQQIGHTVFLAILEGTELIYLEHVQAGGARFSPRLQRPPTLATAAGRVLVAFAPHAIQTAVLSQRIDPVTPFTVTSPEELQNELHRVHGQQFSVAERQVEANHSLLAAPVLGSDGSVLAAISVAIPYLEPQDAIGSALRGAARRASERAYPW